MAPADPLARLLDILQPSLAMYLSDSGIWTYPGDEEIKLALADLVGDHRSLVERAAVMLEERGLPIPPHAYPISFTSCHDVDIGSLVPRVIEGLRGQVSAIDSLQTAAACDPAAAGLAAEAKATSLRHVEVLRQVAAAAGLRRAAAQPSRGSAAATVTPAS
jgi:hypothetical protein